MCGKHFSQLSFAPLKRCFVIDAGLGLSLIGGMDKCCGLRNAGLTQSLAAFVAGGFYEQIRQTFFTFN